MKRIKRHGFTLIELLATIAIVAVITAVSLFSIVYFLGLSEEKSNEATLNSIKKAANNYAIEYGEKLTWTNEYKDNGASIDQTGNEYFCTTIQMLLNKGYLKKEIDVIDESSGQTITNDTAIKITRNKNTYALDEEIIFNSLDCESFEDIPIDASFVVTGKKNNDDNPWYIKEVQVSVDAIVGKAGLKEIEVYVKNNNNTIYTFIDNKNPVIFFDNIPELSTISSDNIKVCTIITNKLDKVSSEFCSETIKIDRSTLESVIMSSDNITSNNWHNSNFQLYIKDITNSISGVKYYLGETNTLNTERKNIDIASSIPSKTYYSKVCNNAGTCSNITEYIAKLDKEKPEIISFEKNTEEVVSSLTLKAKFKDDLSGIVKYKISQDNSYNTNDWITIENTTSEVTKELTINRNGTYYIWVEDAMGNYNSESIIVSNAGTIKTISFITNKNYNSSTISESYSLGSKALEIISVSSNTGTVSSHSLSSGTLNYTVNSGAAQSENYNGSCSISPDYTNYLYYSNQVCTCPGGGSVGSNGMCTYTYGADRGVITMFYSCTANGWQFYGDRGSSTVNCGSDQKVFSCGTCYPNVPCNPGETSSHGCSAFCDGYCVGTTAPTCVDNGYYYCPYGYSESSYGCYKCPSGTYQNGSCVYSCTQSRNYYQYTITVTYLEGV